MAETPLASEGSAGRLVRVDWAATLAKHDRWLRTAVLARLREPHAVDEVMQELALAAVAQKAPLKDADRVGAWLYRLALRMVLLYRRRHGRQSRLVNNYAKKRPLAAASDPLDWLLRAERRDLVQEALGLLPRRDAEILLLKYTEDWTYRDLAIHLGVTESAVETRLHRARGRLRQVLVGKGAIEVSK